MDFKLSNGFFDLCINVSDRNTIYLKNILQRLYQSKCCVVRQEIKNNNNIFILLIYLILVGYRTVALNQVVHESIFDTDKKKKKKSDETKELPNTVPDPIDVSKLNEEFEGKLHILNRITFVCSDSTKTHTLVCSCSHKTFIICLKQVLQRFSYIHNF